MMWPLPLGSSISTDASASIVGLMPLIPLLLSAVRSDLRDHRIPNHLVLVGIVSGLVLHTILPAGNGFLVQGAGGLGLGASLLGLFIGAAALLPLYWLGAMGAGDVKLMAAVGAILGPSDVVPALLGTFVAGGMVSLAVTGYLGNTGRLFRNLAWMVQGRLLKLAPPGKSDFGPTAQSAGTAPYAVSVALGTLGGMLWAVTERTLG